MEPALHGCTTCQDDRIIVFRPAYRLRAVHHGHVVVFTRCDSCDSRRLGTIAASTVVGRRWGAYGPRRLGTL